MASNHQSNYCRVCGLDQGEPTWGIDDKTPSFAICYCCGVEFGYEDSSFESVKKYREVWFSKGNDWFNPKKMPERWSLKEELKNIPKEFQ